MGEMEELRSAIRRLIRKYDKLRRKPFVPGQSELQYAGSVYDEKELIAAIDSLLDGWFGLGKNAGIFENRLASYVGAKKALLTNSGSSANLVAVSAFTSYRVNCRIEKGSEVVTPATTFPTTINPIVQNGMVPVLLDIKLGNYNIEAERIEDAITEKTRMLMLPHTLGNPNQMDYVMEIAEKHDLRVVEDSCDALGSTFKGKKTGSFGDFGTFSFYPAHQITTGEGGAVVSSDLQLAFVARSLRDWGRDYWRRWDEKNPEGAYKSRFKHELGGVPYDRRFVYSEVGYNLKPTELQAAFGVEQMKKLPEFIRRRKENFRKLYEFFTKYEKWFMLPEATPDSDPCWFSFPLTVRDGARFGRNELMDWLGRNQIETRPIFSGNITMHPAYKNVNYRVAGKLDNSDKVMKDSFFIGLYPGINDEMLDYVYEKIDWFMKKHM